jgi:hypothetical protein
VGSVHESHCGVSSVAQPRQIYEHIRLDHSGTADDLPWSMRGFVLNYFHHLDKRIDLRSQQSEGGTLPGSIFEELRNLSLFAVPKALKQHSGQAATITCR